ncbi:hypothetical protein FF1_010461 [Malus domestica]
MKTTAEDVMVAYKAAQDVALANLAPPISVTSALILLLHSPSAQQGCSALALRPSPPKFAAAPKRLHPSLQIPQPIIEIYKKIIIIENGMVDQRWGTAP